MILFDGIGPNPQVVRLVLAQKGVEVTRRRVDLMGAENRQPAFLAVNPMGQLPALQLDDGTVLSEITAIAEYLEELHPSPPLIGTTPAERAETRMWVRRLDLNIVEPMTAGYRYGEGAGLFEGRVPLIPEASAGLKRLAQHHLAWLDRHWAGRSFVVGERFTLADILLWCFLSFGGKVGQPLDPAFEALGAWYGRVGARLGV